jgi:hypothetical protein
MRKKDTKLKFSIHAMFIIVLFLILNIVFSPAVVSSQEQLYISCLDEVDENQEFFIGVYTIGENDTIELQNDVNITFQGTFYHLTDDLLSLTAPSVTQDTDFDITASKEGFINANKTITVLNLETDVSDNSKLRIVPESYLLNPNEQFYVKVYDDDNNYVQGARVYVRNYGDTKTTNDEGIAILSAPPKGEEIIVIASKEGYTTGSIEITIRAEKPFWGGIIEHKLFPLFAAVIILILAIILVHLRQRKSIYDRAKQISNNTFAEKNSDSEDISSKAKKYGYDSLSSSEESVHIRPSSNSKVEEIRITRPQKQKEVIPVKTDEKKSNKQSSKLSDKYKDVDNWFEGTDDNKYEIDRLTGKIDEEGLDKWFEGTDGLKDKVKEKMKKKKKGEDTN